MIEWICATCREIETTSDNTSCVIHRHTIGTELGTRIFILTPHTKELLLDANSAEA